VAPITLSRTDITKAKGGY